MGEPSEDTASPRAALLGYASTDPEGLAHIDWAVYALAGTIFQSQGGGEDLSTLSNASLRARLAEVSGVDIANPVALNNILWGTEG